MKGDHNPNTHIQTKEKHVRRRSTFPYLAILGGELILDFRAPQALLYFLEIQACLGFQEGHGSL
jgi:hypothetical protein